MKIPCSIVSRAIFAPLLLLPLQAGSTTVTNWNSGNFNTNNGYVRGSSAPQQPTNVPAGQQWYTDDPFVGGYGDTSLIAWVQYNSLGTSASGANSLVQGGNGANAGFLPGITNPILGIAIPPATGIGTPSSVSFFVDFSVNPSWNVDPSFPSNDTFTFDLRNTANSLSLAQFRLNGGATTNTNFTMLQWVRDGVSQNLAQLSYLNLKQMEVVMSGTNLTVQIFDYSITNRNILVTNFFALTNGALSTGTTAADFGTLEIGWELASGNIDNPGSNFLIVNQAYVTSTGNVIPEASTLFTGALLAFVAAVLAIRRRKTLQPDHYARLT